MASAAEPSEPDACGGMHQILHALRVAVDAEVVEVTTKASRERSVLHRNRVMPVAPAILGDGLNGPS